MKKTKKIKLLGYKIIFNTTESLDEVEEVLDEALAKLSARKTMDFVLAMTDEEIDKTMENLINEVNKQIKL